MKTITTKFAGILGLTVVLALSGVPQQSAAQTSGAEKQTKQRTVRAKQPREPAARSAQARARQQEQSGSDDISTSALPGYGARPDGMCWTRQSGAGHDLSGHWGPCGSGSQ